MHSIIVFSSLVQGSWRVPLTFTASAQQCLAQSGREWVT
jgi:hypothetical protein